MVCVTARGSDYSPAGSLHALDFQEPYLRSIFGFVGITDIDFICAQPTDISALRDAAMTTAITRAQDLAPAFAAPAVHLPHRYQANAG